MEKTSQPTKRIFNRLSLVKSEAYHDKLCAEHLKPLSLYSRMITCGNTISLHDSKNFSNPFINFKVEVVNVKSSTKRRLDDSCLDVTYETPAKKPYSPNTVSPDHGCVIDSCSPLPIEDLVSPSTISQSVLLNGPKAIRIQNKETVKFWLDLKQNGPSTESGGSEEEGTTSHYVKFVSQSAESLPEKVLNLGPAFDLDVEDILCLSPIGNDLNSPRGFANVVGNCKCPSTNRFQNEPVVIPKPGQGMDERDGKEEGRGEELKKGMYVKVTNEEEGDWCYFSMSYMSALKARKKPFQPRFSLLPQTTSSPLVMRGKKEVLEGEADVFSPSEPDYINQPAVDCSFTLSRASLVPVEGAIEPLEGDVGELWNIGDPKFESSMCHIATVKPSAGSENGSLGGEEVEGDEFQSIQECQVIRAGEEVTVDTSFETTLPLQVQVKSVVVVPNCQASTSKSTAPPQPLSRPVIFDRAEDWQREKRLYVHSVTSHMTENAGQDVMAELLNLMTQVAGQGPGSNGRQWQHPSDLTRRNYQRQFGNMTPMISLDEWQAQNCRSHQRFAKVPKIFERSSVP